MADKPEGYAAIQWDVNRLESWLEKIHKEVQQGQV